MSSLATPYRNGSGHQAPDVEFMALDEKLRDEMRRLSEINDELLGRTRSDADISLPHVDPDPQGELLQLRAENAQLRQRLYEVEQVLEQVAATEEGWAERQKEYETLLEEKSEVIRALHGKVKEMQSAQASAPAANPGRSSISQEEYKDLKAELDEQRRQLQQDEESLMQQMRQMEMAMSRDRAELARQRSELQRIQSELNHEIEMASRDPDLRVRLQSLQRRQQDVLARKGGAASAPKPAPARVEPAHDEETPTTDNPRKSGFFGRLFGK